jgi:hypothetical protein
MRHKPLTPYLFKSLHKHTSPDPYRMRSGFLITDWFRHAGSWVRFCYDPEGLEGVHRLCRQMARVHFVHEAAFTDESDPSGRAELVPHPCWRWQMFSSASGARIGFSRSETNCNIKAPLKALAYADAFLERDALWPHDFPKLVSEDYFYVPYVEPLGHAGHRLLTWHRVMKRGNRRSYDERYVRVWVHTSESLAALPAGRRTGQLVQRVFPNNAQCGAVVMLRGRKWRWSIRINSAYEEGDARSKEHGMELTHRLLLDLGAQPVDLPPPRLSFNGYDHTDADADPVTLSQRRAKERYDRAVRSSDRCQLEPYRGL